MMKKNKFLISILSLPWNQHSVLGWTVEAIYCVLTVTFYLFINPAFLTLFISICEYHRAFYEMFCYRVKGVGARALDRPYRNYDVKDALYETVSYHIAVKEWVFRIENKK